MKVEEKSFSLVLFSALLGFLVANIFGTFLTALRDYVVWDGFIIVGLVVFVETINLSVYKVFKSVPITPSLARGSQRTPSAFEDARGVLNTKESPFTLRNKSDTLLNSPRRRNFLLCQLLNSFKLGLLLGFFVEAFKVGS